METVKVDIRKLQLLTERINQTIEALNQVRLSVHGLQAYGQQQPYPQYVNQGVWPQGFENRFLDPRVYAQGLGGMPPFGTQGIPTPFPYGPQIPSMAGYGIHPFAFGGNPWAGGDRMNGGRPGEQNGQDLDPNSVLRHTQVFPNAFAGAAH